jgi:hypothetical protein
MRRWLFGSLSGLMTAVTIAAAAFGAVTFKGTTTEELLRDLAIVEREIVRAEHDLATFRDRPVIADQIALRIAVLETTRAMLEQKRASWLRGLRLIYRVDGQEVVPDRDALAALKAQLDDTEAGMLTARRWAARSTNEVTKNMALAMEQVHLLTQALIREQMALEGLGMALPTPPEVDAAMTPSLLSNGDAAKRMSETASAR